MRSWPYETGSAARPARARLSSTLRLNLVLTQGLLPPAFRDGVIIHLFLSTAIRHRVRPEFIGSRKCVPLRSLPRVRRHMTSSPQGSSSNEVLPFQVSPWIDFLGVSLFPHPLIACSGYVWYMIYRRLLYILNRAPTTRNSRHQNTILFFGGDLCVTPFLWTAVKKHATNVFIAALKTALVYGKIRTHPQLPSIIVKYRNV